MKGMFSGSFKVTNQFYSLAADLAYKKQQRSSLGEENGDTARIEHLRGELAKLSMLACV
jgi:hypothetical protein